jgi:hypothetical protein
LIVTATQHRSAGYELRSRRFPHAFAMLLALALLAGATFAQSYPNRVIKLVVLFSPGGQPDTIALIIAQQLSAQRRHRHHRQPAGRQHHDRNQSRGRDRARGFASVLVFAA